VVDRGGKRLHRQLHTVKWQAAPFLEAIVVDGSTKDRIAQRNHITCLNLGAKYIRAEIPFNLSRFYNIGIRASSHEATHLCCTGVDFLFSRNYAQELSNAMNGIDFARSQGAILPKNVDYSKLDNWTYLLSLAQRRFPLGLAILCAPRSWWYKIRGYDESLNRGLGVMDMDVVRRAEKDNLILGNTLYSRTQVLHQWHPRSPLKRANRPLKNLDPPVIANPKEWGEL